MLLAPSLQLYNMRVTNTAAFCTTHMLCLLIQQLLTASFNRRDCFTFDRFTFNRFADPVADGGFDLLGLDDSDHHNSSSNSTAVNKTSFSSISSSISSTAVDAHTLFSQPHTSQQQQILLQQQQQQLYSSSSSSASATTAAAEVVFQNLPLPRVIDAAVEMLPEGAPGLPSTDGSLSDGSPLRIPQAPQQVCMCICLDSGYGHNLCI
jgi:hypothetical protein